MDLYSRVPKDKAENFDYRVRVRRHAAHDERFRAFLMEGCRRDFLYWVNVFCFLFEPRPRIVDGVRQSNVLPFITWPHQDEKIREILPHLGYEDVGVVKSRGEGMSWIGVMLALHSWLFEPYSKIGLVSRTEQTADDPEDSDSLFWKIDWQLSKLPLWMSGKRGVDWKRIIDRHTLTNRRNGSSITAGAATGDVFRGGRLTWALMDEFAFFKKGEDADALNASHGATNSRLFVSTVNGSHNEFYRIIHEPSSMVNVVIDWKQNVSRNRGLYVFRKGKPVAVDSGNPLPPHYDPPSREVMDLFSRLRRKGFRLEQSERSPWYDHECDRPGMTPQRIAQELDMDFAGSDFLVFGSEFQEKVKSTVVPPVHVGNFTLMEDTSDGELSLDVQWQTAWDGNCEIWLPLDARGRPPRGNYVLSADIASGLGGSHSSNSTLVAINADTREQVLGFASNTVQPADFADLSVGISKWLWDAYLGWESNGQQGGAYTKRIRTLGYGNCYYRQQHDRRGRVSTKQLGWWTDDKTKGIMFAEAMRTIRSGEVVVRCGKLAKEFSQYVYVNGKIEHAESLTTSDDSSRGKAHGDRVIAFGVACQLLLDRPSVLVGSDRSSQAKDAEPDTMAYRMGIYADEDRVARVDRDAWRGSVLSRR